MDESTVQRIIDDLKTDVKECNQQISKLQLQIKGLELQRKNALVAIPHWEKQLSPLKK